MMPALAHHHKQAIRTMLATGAPRKVIAREVGVSVRSVFKHGGGVERPRFVPSSKNCVVCGAAYYPTAPSLTPAGWAKRVACSNRCGCSLSWSKS